jgi:uncharacterized pyridoxal phosphate-containing UPF0001 family protein
MTSRYDEIASNLDRVREAVKSAATSAARKYEDITLIAVTKTFPVSDVHILASLDVHHYGENRDSDAAPKAAAAPADLSALADSVLGSTHLDLMGLMAVAPLEVSSDQAFEKLATIYGGFKASYPMATSLSAGMSNDFESAICHGATHIRVGSSILGSRPTPQ